MFKTAIKTLFCGLIVLNITGKQTKKYMYEHKEDFVDITLQGRLFRPFKSTFIFHPMSSMKQITDIDVFTAEKNQSLNLFDNRECLKI